MTSTASFPRGETTEIFTLPFSMKYTASDVCPWEKIRVPFAGVTVLLPVLIARSKTETCESERSGLRDSLFLVFALATIATPKFVFDTHQKKSL
jgi:hypothetical protein